MKSADNLFDKHRPLSGRKITTGVVENSANYLDTDIAPEVIPIILVSDRYHFKRNSRQITKIF